MNKYFIDSYAWLEYLDGSSTGKKVEKIIEDPNNQIYANSIVIAEVVSKTMQRGRDTMTAFDALTTSAQLVDIVPELAYEAAIIHAEFRKKIKNFPMADALILTCSNFLNAKLVTGDPHFKNMKNVLFL